jgi:hypothetical protein
MSKCKYLHVYIASNKPVEKCSDLYFVLGVLDYINLINKLKSFAVIEFIFNKALLNKELGKTKLPYFLTKNTMIFVDKYF